MDTNPEEVLQSQMQDCAIEYGFKQQQPRNVSHESGRIGNGVRNLGEKRSRFDGKTKSKEVTIAIEPSSRIDDTRWPRPPTPLPSPGAVYNVINTFSDNPGSNRPSPTCNFADNSDSLTSSTVLPSSTQPMCNSESGQCQSHDDNLSDRSISEMDDDKAMRLKCKKLANSIVGIGGCQNRRAQDQNLPDDSLDHTEKLLREGLTFLSSDDDFEIPSLESCDRFSDNDQTAKEAPPEKAIGTVALKNTSTVPSASVVSQVMNQVDDVMSEAIPYEMSDKYRQDHNSRKKRRRYKRNKESLHQTRHKW